MKFDASEKRSDSANKSDSPSISDSTPKSDTASKSESEFEYDSIPESERVTALEDMPDYSRQDFYREHFDDGAVTPLQFNRRPTLCDDHPTLEQEILDAYFRYTTFSIQVGMNYDPRGKQFLLRQVPPQVGIIVADNKYERLHFQELELRCVQLGHVLLEICAQGKLLWTMLMTLVPSEREGGSILQLVLVNVSDEDPRVGEYLRAVCRTRLAPALWPRERTGLMMQNLRAVAAFFWRTVPVPVSLPPPAPFRAGGSGARAIIGHDGIGDPRSHSEILAALVSSSPSQAIVYWGAVDIAAP